MASMREILSSVGFVSDPVMAEENDILNGAQLSDKCIFKNKKGRKISVVPLIVDLRRLLQSKSSIEVVPGICNQDLLHAVVALYDVSLNEMTPDVLYATVCEKWARTVLLIRDVKDLLQENENKGKCNKNSSPESENINKTEKEYVSASHGNITVIQAGDATPAGQFVDIKSGTDVDEKDGAEEEEDVFVAEEEKPNFFADVFSDLEEEEEEEEESEGSEDGDEEEDFSKGVRAFLKSVADRRQARQQGLSKEMGIESRLVAAATFEKTYCKPNEKVVQLTLLAVRKGYRNWGIGKYLLSQIKKPRISTPYDAIIVHADPNAIEFFEKNGFSADVVLNSKWNELTERFTNCTLMSYLPGFSDQSAWSTSIAELDIARMEREIAKWRERSMEAYRAEIGCVRRLRQEVIQLRAKVSSQQQLIDSLSSTNSELYQDKFLLEKQFLEYKLLVASAALTTASDDEDDASTEQLLEQLEKHTDPSTLSVGKTVFTNSEGEVQTFMLSRGSHPEIEPYDHGLDTAEFYRVTCEFNEAGEKDNSLAEQHHVKTVFKALLPPEIVTKFYSKLESLQQPENVERLYFCGTLDDSQRAAAILKEGFSEDDFTEADYGRGLYFCKRPSDAAQFSAEGNLLVAEVGIGKVTEVTDPDPARCDAGPDADSLCVSTDGCEDGAGLKGERDGQIIVFDPTQVVPVHLIHYTTQPKDACSTTSTNS